MPVPEPGISDPRYPPLFSVPTRSRGEFSLAPIGRIGTLAVRLAWVVAEADPKIASFRYRCLIPAWGLHRLGCESRIFSDAPPDPRAFDALIVVKLAEPQLAAVAKSFRACGKPIILDLCDNVFIPGYARRRGPELCGKSVADLLVNVDAVVTPTAALARVVLPHIVGMTGVAAIPDAAMTMADYQAMCAWLPARIDYASAKSRPGHAGSRRWRAGTMLRTPARGRQGPFARLRNGASEERRFGPDTDWLVDHLPKDTGRVLWFGRHGSSHSLFGMSLIEPLMPVLERMHRHRPIELVVASNNQDRYEALTGRARLFTRYEAWSSERVFFELSRSDAVIMPNGADAFAVCKSANRAVLALANNVPVVASYLEALEPLKRAIVIDDWQGGLHRYLLGDGADRAVDLARGRSILASQFGIDVIARQWAELLEALLQAHRAIDCRRRADTAAADT